MNAQGQAPPRGGNTNRGRRKQNKGRGGRGGGRGGRQNNNRRGNHNGGMPQGMNQMGGQQPQYGGFQQRGNFMQPQFNQAGNFNMLGGGFGAPAGGGMPPMYGGGIMPGMNFNAMYGGGMPGMQPQFSPANRFGPGPPRGFPMMPPQGGQLGAQPGAQQFAMNAGMAGACIPPHPPTSTHTVIVLYFLFVFNARRNVSLTPLCAALSFLSY